MSRRTGRAANPRGSPHTYRITALLNAREHPEEGVAVQCLCWGREELGYTDRFFTRVALEAFWQMYKVGQQTPPDYGQGAALTAGITAGDIDRLAAQIESRITESLLQALMTRGLILTGDDRAAAAAAITEAYSSAVDMSAFGGEFFQFDEDDEEDAP